MKFSLAVTALTFTGAAAFTPRSLGARAETAAHMSAVESKTYTFAKSEEIFAEAQGVRYIRVEQGRIRCKNEFFSHILFLFD